MEVNLEDKLVSVWCHQNNIIHVFTHKARPIENGHVERIHRTDEEEFYLIESLGTTFEELRSKFAKYLEMYNYDRPHWGRRKNSY